MKRLNLILCFLVYSASSTANTPEQIRLQINLKQLHISLIKLNSALKTLSQKPEPSEKFAYKTLSEWKTAIDLLPYYQTIGESYQNKPKELTAQEIQKTIASFKETMEKSLSNNTLWVDGNAPDAMYIQDPSFKPFVQKLELPIGSEVAFHGDLHGDIHAVVADLVDLKSKGYIDDTFKIIKDNFYMVYLGDYVDRGNYGIEVIYTLMRLKIANPDRVFMARGNHEDITLNDDYGFTDEVNTKFSEDPSFINKIKHIYDLMPVVIYVGSGSHFIQCNHGGMELGYLPRKLLNFNKPIAFEWLGQLKRKTNLEKFAPTEFEIIEKTIELAGKKMEADKGISEDEAQEWIAYKNFEPQNTNEIGFLWNDFIVSPNIPLQFTYNRGWVFGKLITESVLAMTYANNKRVVGIFRAHQHGDSDMMGEILYGPTKGAAKLWENDQTTDLWDGIVITHNVTPDTAYGKRNKFKYDTYGLLTIGKEFPKDWKYKLVNVDVVP